MTETGKAAFSMDEDARQKLDERVVRILTENHRRFRSFLAARVGSEALADDLLQESLRRAVETPARSTTEESILAWFYRILRNAVVDHYRASAAEGRKLDALEASLRNASGTPTPDELRGEICECMKGLLPTLKPEYAELLARIDLGEETPESVAKKLGITRNNVDVRLHRARRALKKSLETACGTCTEHGCLDCTCR